MCHRLTIKSTACEKTMNTAVVRRNNFYSELEIACVIHPQDCIPLGLGVKSDLPRFPKDFKPSCLKGSQIPILGLH